MALKKKQRQERERLVLIGLVDLFLATGRPIGSQTLKEEGFKDLSSATIRNYFAKLEKAGYIIQQHSSGGRIPTSLAFKEYADQYYESHVVSDADKKRIDSGLKEESREMAGYMQRAAELLSELTGCATFLSAPRFDQDFIVDVKLVGIDNKRCLCVLITDFGIVNTEILYTPKKLSNFSLKRIEHYFHFRMTGLDKPKLSEQEEALAIHYYNEVLLRHIVGYSNFTAEDLYKTGFSKLLEFPEFRDATALAYGLSLFEDTSHMRALLSDAMGNTDISFWIGEELTKYTTTASHCAILSIPYSINQKEVGAIGLLGPNRIPYKKLFGILRYFAEVLSETLTANMYKYKITYRQPTPPELSFESNGPSFLGQVQYLSLEDQTKHVKESTNE